MFVSERCSPFTTAGLTQMIERAAAAAGLELKAHPTCCGMPAATPANKGQPSIDYQYRSPHGPAEQVQGLLAGVIAL
jgi:hypothetical protein